MMSERLKQRAAILFLALLAGAMTLAFSQRAYHTIRHAVLGRSWPQTVAVVVEQTRRDEVFDRQPRATASVRYVYSVGGLEYTGVEHRDSATVAVIDELLKAHPVGRTFSVRYNPAAPHESVIHIGLTPRAFLDLTIAVLAVVAALALAISAVRGAEEG